MPDCESAAILMKESLLYNKFHIFLPFNMWTISTHIKNNICQKVSASDEKDKTELRGLKPMSLCVTVDTTLGHNAKCHATTAFASVNHTESTFHVSFWQWKHLRRPRWRGLAVRLEHSRD